MVPQFRQPILGNLNKISFRNVFSVFSEKSGIQHKGKMHAVTFHI